MTVSAKAMSPARVGASSAPSGSSTSARLVNGRERANVRGAEVAAMGREGEQQLARHSRTGGA